MQKSRELLCVCGRSFGRAQHGTGSDARLIRGDFPEGVLGVYIKRNSEDVALQPGFSEQMSGFGGAQMSSSLAGPAWCCGLVGAGSPDEP